MGATNNSRAITDSPGSISILAVSLAYLAGTVLVLYLPRLPDFEFEFLLPIIAVLLGHIAKRKNVLRIASVFISLLLAVSVSLYQAKRTQADQLDASLTGQTTIVQGWVISLPKITKTSAKYAKAKASQLEQNAEFLFEPTETSLNLPAKFRVNWYRNAPSIAAAEKWQLQLRLKPPRGKLNFQGFDYERWLFRQNIGGLASVVAGHRLESADVTLDLQSLSWRQQLLTQIETLTSNNSQQANALIRALGVADKSAINQSTRDLFARTGTAHLLAISGLHIGLVSIVGVQLGRLFLSMLGFLLPGVASKLTAKLSRQRLVLIPALLLALLYATLAGWTLPTQRAVLMLIVIFVGFWFRHKINPWQAWSLALLLVLMLDPFSVLDGGFWLSFTAVACLIFFLSGTAFKNRIRSVLWAQWVVVIGLLPLTILLFSRIPLASMPGNIVAIPLTGMLLVPLILLALLFATVFPVLSSALLTAIAWLLERLISYLVWLDHYVPAIDIHLGVTDSWLISLSACSALLVLLPRGVPKYALALLFLIPLAIPYRSLVSNSMRVEVLDVGQGLAVLVETQKDLMLYDSGPGDGRGRDVVSSVLEPAIKATGRRLSTIIISHGDSDHSGGLQSLQKSYPNAEYYLNQPIVKGARDCDSKQLVAWGDDSVFTATILHPNPELPYLGNDSSCVLLMRFKQHNILLTGDISQVIEQRLLRVYPNLRASLILVPHHGSKSSSSAAFIEKINPEIAVISSGFGNRFNLPANEVVEKYIKAKTELYDTARCGAVRVTFFTDKQLPEVNYARSIRQSIWRQSASSC